MHRRRFLGLATMLGCLAGCNESDDGNADADTTTTPTAMPTETAATTTVPAETESPTATPTPTPGPGTYDAALVREEARTVAYERLLRNFEEFQGNPVYFEFGQVYQTSDEGDYQSLQLIVSNDPDSWAGDIAARYYGGDRLSENDRLELWGIAEFLDEVETAQRGVRTVPSLTLVEYELRED